MSLITFNDTTKNTNLTITLNLDELADISKISNSLQFSNKNAWSSVIVLFVNPLNNQSKKISFSVLAENETSSTSVFFSPFYTGNNVSISTITVVDKENGLIVLKRSDIPDVENYDLVLTTSGFEGDGGGITQGG
jgi:hypothetical protein